MCWTQWNPQQNLRCRLYVELDQTAVEDRAAELRHWSVHLRRTRQHANTVGCEMVDVSASNEHWTRSGCDSRCPVSSLVAHAVTSTVCQHLKVNGRAVQHATTTVHHDCAESYAHSRKHVLHVYHGQSFHRLSFFNTNDQTHKHMNNTHKD